MKPKVVVVLSAPRSGSSALTSMLAELGLDVGPRRELKRGSKHNKYGYFESIAILRVNEAILSRSYPNPARKFLESTGLSAREVYKALSSWHWCGHYKPVSAPLETGDELSFRMKEIIYHISPSDSLAVWKDARFCMTLPVWEKFVNPLCIVLWRAPEETAFSIEDMTSIPIQIGLDLWYSYTRAAVVVSDRYPRLLISHAMLMNDPLQIAHKLRKFLTENGLEVSEKNLKNASQAIDTSQYHQRGNGDIERSPHGHVHEQLAHWLHHQKGPIPPPYAPTVPIQFLPIIGAAWYVKRRNIEQLKDILRIMPGYALLRRLYQLRSQ
jgi:hypothetical protein